MSGGGGGGGGGDIWWGDTLHYDTGTPRVETMKFLIIIIIMKDHLQVGKAGIACSLVVNSLSVGDISKRWWMPSRKSTCPLPSPLTCYDACAYPLLASPSPSYYLCMSMSFWYTQVSCNENNIFSRQTSRWKRPAEVQTMVQCDNIRIMPKETLKGDVKIQ